MLILIALPYRVVKNEHFQSILLGESESQEYSVYGFDNVDNNLDDPKGVVHSIVLKHLCIRTERMEGEGGTMPAYYL